MLARFGGVHGHDINREMQIIRKPPPVVPKEPKEPASPIPIVDGVEGVSYELLEISCDLSVPGYEVAKNLFDNTQYSEYGTHKWNGRTFGPATLVITVKGGPIQLSHYALRSANDDPSRDPRSWKMIAVHDIGSQCVMHDMKYPYPIWTDRWQWRKFSVDHNFKAKMFILQIEGNGGNRMFTQLGQMALFKVNNDPQDAENDHYNYSSIVWFKTQ